LIREIRAIRGPTSLSSFASVNPFAFSRLKCSKILGHFNIAAPKSPKTFGHFNFSRVEFFTAPFNLKT